MTYKVDEIHLGLVYLLCLIFVARRIFVRKYICYMGKLHNAHYILHSQDRADVYIFSTQSLIVEG